MSTRGIILAGGRGTRLYPATAVVSKQLLPVYDTPMVFHPLALLMRGGIREVLLISTPEALPSFQALLGDGSRFGMRLIYAQQDAPRGIAEALIIAEPFLDGAGSVLVLGDNLFIGTATPKLLRRAVLRPGASVFAVEVDDPRSFGVVNLDVSGRALGLEEKPAVPKSNLAVTGLYVYDGAAPALARSLAPSPRGELEITDLNRAYLDRGALSVERLPLNEQWFDTGTPESLLSASSLVHRIERNTGQKLACLEAIAFQQGWITHEMAVAAGRVWGSSLYGRHLQDLPQLFEPELGVGAGR
jgi:glucose-1-phosphate thymidylyltransferase